MYDGEHGQRVPLFFSRNRKVNHIDLLHDVTERTMAEQMERYARANGSSATTSGRCA